ncbi:MAG TPA: nicotinate-nucleotide adenylyltransferase [Longimicrobiaceae bacterium]|nr:nicotinate-nucleotide adenylyltransferase [Longimicrobiaceae bacterium]
MRIGVFGGTFDPPHHGHLVVAADVHAALELDRVVLVPSAAPPHKLDTVQAPAETRLEMVRAAVRGDDRFEVDDLELRRPGPSYTVDTLRALRDRCPGAELFFVVGADNVPELGSWREPEEVVRLARIVAVARGCENIDADAPFPLLSVPVTRVEISATDVRRRVAEGRSIRYLVPDAVCAIVAREGLYRDPVHSGKNPC